MPPLTEDELFDLHAAASQINTAQPNSSDIHRTPALVQQQHKRSNSDYERYYRDLSVRESHAKLASYRDSQKDILDDESYRDDQGYRDSQDYRHENFSADVPWLAEVRKIQTQIEKRDEAALKYSQNRLDKGDTLVVTSRQSSKTSGIFDPLGFRLDSEYRIGSAKLLATGSSYFKRMLGGEEQKKLCNSSTFDGRVLPEGVQFVLDLSPDNEDGEVMLHELSCPEGIRYWFRSNTRNDVASYLVLGGEEKESAEQAVSLLTSKDVSSSNSISLLSKQLGPESKMNLGSNSCDISQARPTIASDSNELTALNNNPPLDYTHVRHRACVERLLQIIDGKHARLDSATKIWTVAMLAGMYDCASAVVDEITSWIYTSNNSRIIEILPEAIFKLGVTLKSYMLTRAAFSVLVAEEAFCMRPDTAPSQRSNITPLGRYRDDHTLGEDHLDMIQKAALTFNEQILDAFSYLVNPEMPWFTSCPEFQKLEDMRERMITDATFNKSETARVAVSTIDATENELRDYFYGRLVGILTRKLSIGEAESADKHRRLEHWSSAPRVAFEEYYEALIDRQRACVRPFWYLVQRYNSAFIFESNVLEVQKSDLPPGIRTMTGVSSYRLANEANLMIFDFVTRDELVDGPFQIKEEKDEDEKFTPSLTSRHQKLAAQCMAATSVGEGPTNAQLLAHELLSLQKHDSSHPDCIFFNVHTFFRQVANYIVGVSNTMLKRNEDCEGFTLAEGLNCLNEHQYKFLPLFAGGCDDGSGGVGTDIPPPSIDNWDQIGPGLRGVAGTNTATAGASTFRGHDAASSVDFGSQKFANLGLLTPRRDKGKGIASYSEADSFSDIGHGGGAAMSEISFASTFDGEHVKSTNSVKEVKTFSNAALDDVMSDDFMLEDSGDLDVDNDSDDFDMLDDDEDDGEQTETED